MSLSELQQQLGKQRRIRQDLEKKHQSGRESLRTMQVKKVRLQRLGKEKSKQYVALLKREKELEKALSELAQPLLEINRSINDLSVHFHELPPQQAVQQLNDHIPFFLFPVRLQTRFKKVENPETGEKEDQLWLRIYPDDINVLTHEEQLSEDEVRAAQHYWQQIWRAGGDRIKEQGAWRALASKYGFQRAAWIVKIYQPNNEQDENGNSNRPSKPLADDEELNPAPAFNEYSAKQESWSLPPRAVALPDRFVVQGFIGGKKVMEYVGNPVPDILIVGPNPSHPRDTDEGFKEDAKELKVDAAMKWMVDFDEAVNVGMGMRIPLDNATRKGFDRIIVLGLHLSDDATQSKQMLESLINNHHYEEDGFSLIPQGVATNNTESGGAGFKSFDPADIESFNIELGKPLFDNQLDWKQKTDGQIFAESIGIDPSVLHHIQFSDSYDQRDARAMNTALWHSTLGYFLEEMMNPVFNTQTVRQVRDFFIRYVSGRGPIPAIRVGNQPYGIVATSSFTRWRYPESVHTPTIGIDVISPHKFEQSLYQFLMRMDRYWQQYQLQVSHAGKPGDSQQNLLDILGLHASSAEFYQRFAISLEQLSNMLRLKQLNLAALDLSQLLKTTFSGVLNEFGVEKQNPEILKKIFYNSHNALNGPLVDEAPLSDTEKVKAISEDDENYLQWLATSDIDTIRRQDFGRKEGKAIAAPKALLYLMLRHAVMNAYWDSAWNFYTTAGLTALAPRKESVFLYLQQQNPGQSKFEALYRPAGELVAKHPSVFTRPDLTVAEQISQDAIIRLRPESKLLHEVRQALDCLKDTPTNALARAFSEHLDLCSYRLDAWLLGLVNQRLQELRVQNETVQQGIYLGAFAWLEEVRPKTILRDFTGTAPEEFLGDKQPPLQVALGNAGYIHSPSLNHAITAAILRNAYITHAKQGNADVTAVNLSSERVRMALNIIEGTQDGQELGALLGYQFERGLHERYNQAEVDKFIYPLRKKFPLVSDQLKPTPEDIPIEVTEARNVINGVSLLRHIDDSSHQSYPFGFTDLPPVDTNQSEAINAEVNRLQNIMDAVSDLMNAESIYQVVRSNYERAGAVMDALSKAENLPTPEILQTVRSGFALTHRLCIQVETGIINHNPYSAHNLPLTPRAKAEPGINKWLAELMGDDPTIIACVQVTEIRLNAGTGGETVEQPFEVALKDLQLQPIDLVYLMEDELTQQQSLLDQRVALATRRKHNLDYDAKLRIDYTAALAGKVTLFELMPLIKSLRRLIVDVRALNAEDLRLPSDDAQDLSAEGTEDLNPRGWIVNEIKTRVQATKQFLDDLKTNLESDKTSISLTGSDSAFHSMRDHLMLAASLGLDNVIPESGKEKDGDTINQLKQNADRAIIEINKRIIAYSALLPIDTAEPPADQVNKWMQAGNLLLGNDFTWTAAFNLKFPDEMENAINDSNHILRQAHIDIPFPIDEWLYGVGRVRDKAKAIEQTILLSENFGKAAPKLTPLQLPYRTDDYWLALHYPPDYNFDGDRLLLNIIFAGTFEKTQPQAGLMIDEWVEVIPTRNETTGISFHYDAPSSEPPNTCILAVTPEVTGQWKWDDLVSTLNETLDLAKIRAVEPKHIDETEFAQFLPAVMVPTTHYLITLATNLLVNVGMRDVIADVSIEEINQVSDEGIRP